MDKQEELNEEFIKRFKYADINIIKLVWLTSVFNTNSNDLRDILNSFDSEEQFRKIVPQIPISEQIKLYDMNFMLNLFKKYGLYGFFAECKVPVRYDFKESESHILYKTKLNPSYILFGYADTLPDLVTVLEEGSKFYMEEDKFIEKSKL